MKKFIPFILLSIIIIVAFALRFYKLGQTPSGFYIDEAGQGYSAYSILKTGKDEFGKSFPILFRSLLDFRAPIYTYLIVPLIPIFGLTPFTVRLPSFIFGFLTVIIFYFLMVEMSGNKKLSLIATLLLAISPWHILFSRTAYESNISLFFMLMGFLTLIKSLKNPKYLFISAVCLALSITAYQSQRVVIPLILLVYFIKYRTTFLDKKHLPSFLVGLALAFIVFIPTIAVSLTPGFWARASGLSIFSYSHQLPDGYIESYKGMLSFLVNGSWFLSAREFFWQYFAYFSPRFMFFLGDSDLHISYPEIATFFVWQLPFYILGLFVLFKKKLPIQLKIFTISMLLASPIPAAITRDPYSTLRSLPLVIPQIIIISLGVYEVLTLKIVKKYNFSAVIISIIIIGYSVFKLYSSAVILNDYYRAKYWSWGWEKVADTIRTIKGTTPVVVDNSRTDPEMILAFFLRYNPASYQKENFEVPLNQYYTNLYRNREKHIGSVITRSINWEKDLMLNEYIVGDELAISPEQIKIHNLKLISEIDYPDGTVAFRIVKTNPEWEKLQRK